MLIVTGTIDVPAENADAVAEAAIAVSQATRAEKGCRVYAFWQSVENPGQFRVYEEWDDLDCLKAHGASDHMGTWRAALKDLGVLGRDVVMFEPGPITKL
ncbi:putative quinol monooxygenase [Arenibacterium halophilum]|uniref:Antibiotic biosynthesis monooxygenase n=1 Tax=Arenibacterium halophilum TaxID=2583821 RepID=A0ABY2XBR0_9RHOB|nr:putative quinol monooxygenase [Arenibacterium halophilum]TMV14439.1 antibiotic biosynthesis monooxygenase [Arenibacterium halophilum]